MWGELVVGESCMEGFKDRFNLVQDQEINPYVNKFVKVVGRDEFQYKFL